MVLKYDGVPVDDDLHLINMVSLTEVGRVVPLVVFRNQQLVNLAVKVGAAPPKEPAVAPAKK